MQCTDASSQQCNGMFMITSYSRAFSHGNTIHLSTFYVCT